MDVRVGRLRLVILTSSIASRLTESALKPSAVVELTRNSSPSNSTSTPVLRQDVEEALTETRLRL